VGERERERQRERERERETGTKKDKELVPIEEGKNSEGKKREGGR
jgi:hypothetical protein